MQCQRCFWLDTRKKIKRPDGPPFQINKAIDELFKKEFDQYRLEQKPHPLMKLRIKVDAVPFKHQNMDDWRHNFTGVVSVHRPTNLHIFGAVDDVWVNPANELIVVDYKATAKTTEVSLDADWQVTYKHVRWKCIEWLLKQNDFAVSDTGYFVYANGRLDLDSFNDRVEFRTKVIPYTGKTDWVEPTLEKMKQVMDSDTMPPMGVSIMGGDCEFCSYARSRTELTLDHIKKK